MSLPKPLPHREEFEKHGETGTRFKFSGMRGEVGKAADAWLAEQQSKRDEECSARRDEREERTLSIGHLSEEQNSSSHLNNSLHFIPGKKSLELVTSIS